jgi:hypothetical protein
VLMLMRVLKTRIFFLGVVNLKFAKLVSSDASFTTSLQIQIQMSVDGETTSYEGFDATDHQVIYMNNLM